jgi:hypothetical protein
VRFPGKASAPSRRELESNQEDSRSLKKASSTITSLFGGVTFENEDDDIEISESNVSGVEIYTSSSYDWIVAIMTYFIGLSSPLPRAHLLTCGLQEKCCVFFKLTPQVLVQRKWQQQDSQEDLCLLTSVIIETLEKFLALVLISVRSHLPSFPPFSFPSRVTTLFGSWILRSLPVCFGS